MLRVCGSSPKYVIRSPEPTSSIEPVDTKALNPTNSRRLQPSTAVAQGATLADESYVPRRAIEVAKVALRFAPRLINPRQFGPIIRILPRGC